MARITDEERKRFHQIVDDSLDKLNHPKNIDKVHWCNLSIPKIEITKEVLIF